jgi:hypothetical protein
MKHDAFDPDLVSPERKEQLYQRTTIVRSLQDLPVPTGSKADDIIWNAIEIINGYERELSVTVERLKVLRDQVQTQQDRLDNYFGGA